MRGKGAIAAIACVAAIAGCTAQQVAEPECWRTMPSPSDYRVIEAGRAGTVNDQDRYFICHATIDGRAETVFDQLAVLRAKNPALREFARQAAGEDSQATDRLAQMAAIYAGVDLPDGLDAAHELRAQQLASLSGAEFDRAYLLRQTQDTEAMIRLYQQETLSGGEPRLQSFAARTVPALKQKLRMARDIEDGR